MDLFEVGGRLLVERQTASETAEALDDELNWPMTTG